MANCDLCAGTGETDQPGYNEDGSWKTERCPCCRGKGNVPSYTDLRKAIVLLAARCDEFNAACADALGLTVAELKAEIEG